MWWDILLGINTKATNLPSNPASEGAVYYDSVHGSAGTDWPIGTAAQPVNNWADLIAIMIARHLPHAILRTTLTALTDLTDALFTTDTNALFEGEGGFPNVPDVQFHINGKAMPAITFKNLRVDDTVGNAGSFLFLDGCVSTGIGLVGTPIAQIWAKNGCRLSGNIFVSSLFSAVDSTLYNLSVTGNILYGIRNCDTYGGGGAGALTIKGLTAVTGSQIHLKFGKVIIDATSSGGSITIYGGVDLTNNGTTTITDKTNLPKAEIRGQHHRRQRVRDQLPEPGYSWLSLYHRRTGTQVCRPRSEHRQRQALSAGEWSTG